MPRYHVLCCATRDAQDLIAPVVDGLRAGASPLAVTLLADGDDQTTIRDCASVIAVVTPASLAEDSSCAHAWTTALRYKKPIVPLLLAPAASLPAQLESRKPIDGTALERGMTQLRSRLQQIDTPRGRLQALKERLADAERDLRQEQEPRSQARARAELALLKQQIEQQQRVADDPERAAKRAGIDITRQIERDRYTSLPADEPQPEPAADTATRLQSLDADAILGLRDAPVDLLDQVGQRTAGDSQALTALAAILAVDRSATLAELLNEILALSAGGAAAWLLSEAFDRLDPLAQQIVQSLAVFDRPVSSTAVDYLLLPYLSGLKTEPTLKRLLSLRLVQQRRDRWELHPAMRDVALQRIPRDDTAEQTTKSPRFTYLALLARAADYFKQARLPEKSWRSLDDLAPQLAEFELRCAAEAYEAAASLLLTIGPSLTAWSQQPLLIRLNQQLEQKLDDYRLQLLTTDQLAAAYQSLGEHETALRYHQRSLALARKHNDRAGEGISLGNLGQHWLLLGRPAQAMEQLTPALTIARETKDPYATQSRLLGLGLCAKEIGATHEALDYDEQALAIARRLGDRGSESVILSNIGLCYGDLGQPEKAIEVLTQAQAVARTVGARAGEGSALVNQAMILIDQEQYAEAERQALAGARIAEEINSPRLASFGSRFLALARLLSGDEQGAHVAAEAALLHRSPEHTQHVLMLLGLIALVTQQRDEARSWLTAALDESNGLLEHTPALFKALDTKGLSLAGLSLLDGAQHVPDAIVAFRAARAINRDAGIVRRVVRLLDTLATVDTAGLLPELRVAAAGNDHADA